MNKTDIVDVVHGVLDCTKTDAARAVDAIFEEIVKTLKKGGEVSVAGFGIFKTRSRAARVGRNPRTGASVKVPAMRVPKFSAAKALKEAIR